MLDRKNVIFERVADCRLKAGVSPTPTLDGGTSHFAGHVPSHGHWYCVQSAHGSQHSAGAGVGVGVGEGEGGSVVVVVLVLVVLVLVVVDVLVVVVVTGGSDGLGAGLGLGDGRQDPSRMHGGIVHPPQEIMNRDSASSAIFSSRTLTADSGLDWDSDSAPTAAGPAPDLPQATRS